MTNMRYRIKEMRLGNLTLFVPQVNAEDYFKLKEQQNELNFSTRFDLFDTKWLNVSNEYYHSYDEAHKIYEQCELVEKQETFVYHDLPDKN